MLLTVASDDNVFSFEVDADLTVSELKGLLEAAAEVPAAQQQLFHQGRLLQGSSSLQAAGVKENDVLQLTQVQPRPAAPPPQQPPAPQAAWPAQAGQAMPFDEMSPEYQQRLEEHIRQQNIQQNMESAWENSPEVFSDVYMLYVNMRINNIDLKVFVDSGAQRSIMSREVAEKCNLLHLIDKRFQGIARGVGEQKIMGRIHAVNVRVGSQHLTMSLTILESGSMDCLFGLDMLRRWGCSIDLKRNVLKFGNLEDLELPFLAEHELPESARISFGPAGQEGPPGTSQPSASAPGAAQQSRAAAGAAAAARAQAAGSQAAANMGIPHASAGPASAGQVNSRAVANGPIAPSSMQQPPAASSAAAPEDKVQLLAALTGEAPERCRSVLQSCNGNVDQAAAALMGFGM